jgi:hypothetical protein
MGARQGIEKHYSCKNATRSGEVKKFTTMHTATIKERSDLRDTNTHELADKIMKLYGKE